MSERWERSDERLLFEQEMIILRTLLMLAVVKKVS